MSLCSPQWLVQAEGASEGLFALCRLLQLHHVSSLAGQLQSVVDVPVCFLSAVSDCCPHNQTCSDQRKAIAAQLLNIISVALCASSLITSLVSIEQQQQPELLRHLSWTFYICCATLFYASLVTVLLGVVHGDGSRVEPAVDPSVIAA